ncbi:MAG: preprotein translocase subunit SecE [Firmicutes bacterium]|jgi:preprotein translocase subunit SecE|nr:preprotein translocase subunit SecE [Bacillota bacterium]MBQ2059302.1 preprotein translocase subunit SecE [Bacillota bacterium]MBQ4372380.1 preprotein translocase subunit SecE [Bacillota bacterium]
MANTNAAAPQKKGRLSEYFKGVRTELKKVVWPTRKETQKYTLIVLVVCAAFALLFWLMDTGILAILEQILNISM